jgi:hypothetical protein
MSDREKLIAADVRARELKTGQVNATEAVNVVVEIYASE